MLKFFVSYRSVDSDKVDMLVAGLRAIQDAEGKPAYQLWQDKNDILPGHDWWQSIVDAIGDCDIVLFMMSRESVRNPFCNAELNYAHQRNRPIIPIVLEGHYIHDLDKRRNNLPVDIEIPQVLLDMRVQYLFYEESSFPQQIRSSIERFRREPRRWRDLPTEYPLDPRQASEKLNNMQDRITSISEQLESSDLLFDQACDYGRRMDYSVAHRLFRKLIHLSKDAFIDESHEWITVLYAYERLVRLDQSENTRPKAAEDWATYEKLIAKSKSFTELFDPKNLRSRYGTTASSKNLPNDRSFLATYDQASPDLLDWEDFPSVTRHTSKDTGGSGKRAPSTSIKPVTMSPLQPQPVDLKVHPETSRESVIKRANSISKPVEQIRSQHLHFVLPWDWLRLYVWLFFRPGKLADHRAVYGERSEKATGSWLASTMTWLPLILLCAGAYLRILPSAENAPLTPQFALTVAVGAWICSGLLGRIEDGGILLLMGIVAVITAIWLMNSVMVSAVISAAVIVAVVTALVVATAVAGGVQLGVSLGVAGGIVFVIAGMVARLIQVNAMLSMAVGIISIAIALIAVASAVLTAVKMSNSIQERRLTFLNFMTGLFYPATFGVIVWAAINLN